MVTWKENAMTQHLDCPSDASLVLFYIICALLMLTGFTSIIALAGELIPRSFWVKEKKD